MLLRRLQQIHQIFFSSDFSDESKISENTIERYSSDKELAFYQEYNLFGLEFEENQCAKLALKFLGNHPKALVIGCGAGREAFALEKLGYDVTAIDLSDEMITLAKEESEKRSSTVNFVNADVNSFESQVKFDFIFVSPGLTGHFPGRLNRQRFYQSILPLVSQRFLLFLYPEIRMLGLHDPMFWSSQLLRLKWLFKNKWEKGDTAKSYFGNHNDEKKLLFYHYYPNRAAFDSEVNEAGLFCLETLSPYLFTSTPDLFKI